MSNLDLWGKVQEVPQAALRTITAGRLKGKSDINPMWRIKTLTELFGVCGVGWKYEITDQWIEPGANNEIAAFCNINLYVKNDDKWSEAIPGTGGSSFVAKERSGLFVSDECYKMALTDAISVACKALGIGADVYWQAGGSKYDTDAPPSKEYKCCDCGKPFKETVSQSTGKKYSAGQMYHIAESKSPDGKARCGECLKKFNEANKAKEDK